jgi:hypothetical protein
VAAKEAGMAKRRWIRHDTHGARTARAHVPHRIGGGAAIRSVFAVAALLLGLAAASPGAPPGGGGIVYGGSMGVAVEAPGGWIFDSKSGTTQGLHAVMYPVGATWDTAKVVMYVRVVPLSGAQTAAQLIADDLAGYREGSPDLKVSDGQPIQVASGATAEVRLCTGDRWGNHEAVAYLAQGPGVAIYVLTSPNPELFESALPAFRAMVAASTPVSVPMQK